MASVARCLAHAIVCCPMCSRNPDPCRDGHTGCEFAGGMHHDTCPYRDRSPTDAPSDPIVDGWGRVLRAGPEDSTRARCLTTALGHVSRDRNAAHGSPESNFENIARFWNAHLRARYPNLVNADTETAVRLDATDVALMMAAMKAARLAHNPAHEDSWVDLAGYAACGMEVALDGDSDD